MTPPTRLEEIKSRLAKASPGPWTSHMLGGGKGGPNSYSVRQSGDDGTADFAICRCTPRLKNDGMKAYKSGVWNADFIAHSPADIAWLVAEVEKVGGLVDEMKSLCDTACKEGQREQNRAKQAEKERDELAALVGEKDKALTARDCHNHGCEGLDFLSEEKNRKHCTCGFFEAQDALELTPPQALSKLEGRVRAEFDGVLQEARLALIEGRAIISDFVDDHSHEGLDESGAIAFMGAAITRIEAKAAEKKAAIREGK